MAAANTDYFTKVGQPGTATTLSSPGHTTGGTTFKVVSTDNWDTTTGIIFAVDTVNPSTGVRVPGSYTEWEGVVTDSTTISNATIRYGTDADYSAGAYTRVYVPVASSRENRLVDGILVAHDQDGTLKAGAVDATAVIADGVVTSAKLAAGVSAAKFLNPYKFSAYRNAALTLTATADTKMPFDAELYDTGSNFDAVTNRRFTAPVDGFYHFSAGVYMNTNTAEFKLTLYVNGAAVRRIFNETASAAYLVGGSGSTDLQLASGDYVELYYYSANGNAATVGAISTYFTGHLISAT